MTEPDWVADHGFKAQPKSAEAKKMFTAAGQQLLLLTLRGLPSVFREGVVVMVKGGCAQLLPRRDGMCFILEQTSGHRHSCLLQSIIRLYVGTIPDRGGLEARKKECDDDKHVDVILRKLGIELDAIAEQRSKDPLDGRWAFLDSARSRLKAGLRQFHTTAGACLPPSPVPHALSPVPQLPHPHPKPHLHPHPHPDLAHTHTTHHTHTYMYTHMHVPTPTPQPMPTCVCTCVHVPTLTP
jgi:hypothetical protein